MARENAMSLSAAICEDCWGEGEYVVGYDCDRGEMTRRCCLGPDFAYDPAALATLAHNLAVAGALCKAFRLGDNYGWTEAMERDDDSYHELWSPNVDGKAAP